MFFVGTYETVDDKRVSVKRGSTVVELSHKLIV